MPTSAQAVRDWQVKNASLAKSNPMPPDAFCENWYLCCKDLVDKYQPDVLYFDTNELPLGQAGLDVVAHYYNLSAARNGGRADVVVNGKHIERDHIGVFVEDIERSTAGAIRPDPWQTDTCIGKWHYSRAVAEESRYTTVAAIVAMLTDIVSKNGNLMLNIPLHGDGSIDEHEEALLAGLTAWMDVNSEGIYATRPWKIYGEGLSMTARPAGRGAGWSAAPAYTSQDIRFTTKADTLYAFAGAWPESRNARIKTGGSLPAEISSEPARRTAKLACFNRRIYAQSSQDCTSLVDCIFDFGLNGRNNNANVSPLRASLGSNRVARRGLPPEAPRR